MAAPGQEIANPITGERVVFRRTGAETGGELLEFDVALRPGGVIAGIPHRHPRTEHFQVTNGRLAGWIAGEGRVWATPGQEVFVPAWRDHFLGNGAAATTRARVVARPAGQFDVLLEAAFTLASGRSLPGRGRLASILELARLVREEQVLVAVVPTAVQRAALMVPAALAPRER